MEGAEGSLWVLAVLVVEMVVCSVSLSLSSGNIWKAQVVGEVI